MQTSGTAPNFSDGVRKTMTTKVPKAPVFPPVKVKAPAMPKAKMPKAAAFQVPAAKAKPAKRGR